VGGAEVVEPGDEMAAAADGGRHMIAAGADREQALDALKAAFVHGRLTKHEFDQRVGRVLLATYAELGALTADIPVGPARTRRPVSGLDVCEIAYLCGGPERVALVVVVAMQQDERITISRSRHRVHMARRTASQPVENAVLDAIPDKGTVLGQLLHDVAYSAAVQELIDGLRRDGLVGRYVLAGHPHLSAAGRKARTELEDLGTTMPRERRVAVLGTSGIADAGLRDIFETPDPPPGGKLLPKSRKTANTYSDAPPGTYIPGYPGVGSW
jgi:Domain of unknown function (DUF1707)